MGLGVDTVASALRVRRKRLEDLLEDLESGAVDHDGIAEFVEVQLPVTTLSSSSDERGCRGSAILVQLEAPDGRRLRLEVPRGVRCDVGAIFGAFREDAS